MSNNNKKARVLVNQIPEFAGWWDFDQVEMKNLENICFECLFTSYNLFLDKLRVQEPIKATQPMSFDNFCSLVDIFAR